MRIQGAGGTYTLDIQVLLFLASFRDLEDFGEPQVLVFFASLEFGIFG